MKNLLFLVPIFILISSVTIGISYQSSNRYDALLEKSLYGKIGSIQNNRGFIIIQLHTKTDVEQVGIYPTGVYKGKPFIDVISVGDTLQKAKSKDEILLKHHGLTYKYKIGKPPLYDLLKVFR